MRKRSVWHCLYYQLRQIAYYFQPGENQPVQDQLRHCPIYQEQKIADARTEINAKIVIKTKKNEIFKALNPVYKAYVGRIIRKVSGISGVLSVNLNSEGQYDFTFTFEKDKESDLSQITEQIRYLLRLYGSTILSVDKG